MDEPGWMTRYIAMYGEAARQETLQVPMILTYVSSDRQLADLSYQTHMVLASLDHLPPVGTGCCELYMIPPSALPLRGSALLLWRILCDGAVMVG